MNAVEIEQAITDLAEQTFDPAEFPYDFLEAFGNKETTLKRLRTGATNKSDLGGVLQTNNIHILTSEAGRVAETLAALKASPVTARAKARFILATDGIDFEAEDLASGDTVACAYKDFPDHFGFFLPLAGISTVREISENAFDLPPFARTGGLARQPFSVFGCHVPDCGMDASAIVVGFDVGEQVTFGVLSCCPLALMDELDLQGVEEALHRRIVVAAAFAAH